LPSPRTHRCTADHATGLRSATSATDMPTLFLPQNAAAGRRGRKEITVPPCRTPRSSLYNLSRWLTPSFRRGPSFRRPNPGSAHAFTTHISRQTPGQTAKARLSPSPALGRDAGPTSLTHRRGPGAQSHTRGIGMANRQACRFTMRWEQHLVTGSTSGAHRQTTGIGAQLPDRVHSGQHTWAARWGDKQRSNAAGAC